MNVPSRALKRFSRFFRPTKRTPFQKDTSPNKRRNRSGRTRLELELLESRVNPTTIMPGFDLFESQPGTEVDLSSFGLGIVPLEGVPLDPIGLGNTDTIVQRLDGIDPFNPPGGSGTVQIELVALHLVSVDPIDLTPLGGPFIGVFADLHTTIDKGDMFPNVPQPDALAPSIGQMEISHLNPFGGTFDSAFAETSDAGAHPVAATLGVPGGGVFADAIFTIVGGDPNNPGDIIFSQPADRIVLSSDDSTWLHIPPPNYPLTPLFPSGGFYVAELPHVGPHPVEPSAATVNTGGVGITTTKVDILTGDVDGDGQTDPSDTITYVVGINNNSDTDATGVQFADTLDPNTTLVPGSIQVTPIAFDDTYDTAPNAPLNIGAGLGLLANDFDPDQITNPPTVVVGSIVRTGGDITGTLSNVQPDGSFDYTPPANQTGFETFSYNIIDEQNLNAVVPGTITFFVGPGIDLDPDNSEGNGPNFAATFNEGDGPLAIADTDAILKDPNDTELESMQLSVSGAGDGIAEEITIGGTAFPFQNTAATGVTGGFDVAITDNTGGSFTIDITATGGGSAPIGDFETLLRAITYQHTDGDDPTGGARTMDVTVNDGTNTSNTATSTITVNPINDEPTLTLDDNNSGGNGPNFAATFNTGLGTPVNITDSDVAITDVDNTTLTSATVTIINPQDGADEVLAATPSGAIMAGDINFAGGVLTITANASLADYQAVLASVTYDNNAGSPTLAPDRVINFVVNDGMANSTVVTSTVTLVAGPLLDLDANDSTAAGMNFAGAFVEDGGAVAVVDTDVDITSFTTPEINQAIITLTNDQDGGAESLFVQGGAGALPAGISLAGDNSDQITLSGNDTAANYEAALQLIRYNNTSDTPDETDRTISITVRDDNNINSMAAIATLTVTPTNDAPTAADQNYAATGNVPIDVPAGSGLLTGSSDPEGDTRSVNSFDATSANGGSITNVNLTTGVFTYTPPAGFEGTDTFTYTLTDDGGGSPVSTPGTVTITVSDMIWFVDSSFGGASDGTLNNPFTSLDPLNNDGTDLDEPSDAIFLFESGSNYNIANSAGFQMENNQILFSEGVTGTDFSTFLSSQLGITLATHSQTTLPAINGTSATITNGAIDGDGIVLAQGNTIRGVDFGDTGSGFNVGSAISGSNFGTLTIDEVNTSGLGKALDLTNGIINDPTPGTSTFGTLAATPGGIVELDDVEGGFVADTTSQTGNLVSGIGVNIQNAGATNDGTTTTLSADFGNFTYTSNLAGAGTGIFLNSNAGTFTFDSITISNHLNGIVAINGGTMNIGGTTNSVSTTGIAIDIQNTTLDDGASGGGVTFASVSSNATSGTADGINLDNVTGFFTANGGTITNFGGVGIDINGGSGNVTYAGMLDNNGGRSVEVTGRTGGTVTISGNIDDDGTGISIANNSGGAITFSGASKAVTTGTNNGVTLSNNTGATINFTGGGLDIDTTSGMGFTASGGGTVNVTGANNTINTTTGTGVNIANTTIGANGVTFHSVSVDGATNGIVLNNTGANAFMVTGTGTTDGSGGTIQNISNRGFSGITVQNVTLTNMNFTNVAQANGADPTDPNSTCGSINVDSPGTNTDCNAAIHLQAASNITIENVTVNGSLQQGINGNDVTDLTLTNVELMNIGNQPRETAIRIRDPKGLFDFNNVDVNTTSEGGIEMHSGSATPLTLNMRNGSSVTNANGNGFQFEAAANGGIWNINIDDSSFTNNFTDGIHVFGGLVAPLSGGTLNVDIDDNIIQDNNFGVNISLDGTATGNITVRNNGSGATSTGSPVRVNNNASHLINVTGDLNAILNANILNNVVDGRDNTAGNLIRVRHDGSTLAAGTIVGKILIDGNNLNNPGQADAIFVNIRDGNSSQQLHATVTNNTMAFSGATALSQDGIEINAQDGQAIVTRVSGNTVSGFPGQPIELRALTGSTVTLFDEGSGSTDPVTILNANNTLDATAITSGSGIVNTTTTAPMLPPAPLFAMPGAAGSPSAQQGDSGATTPTSADALSNEDIVAASPGQDDATATAGSSTVAGSVDEENTFGSAAARASAIVNDGVLSPNELRFIVDASSARWAATGLSPEQTAALQAVSFTVGDMPGWYLGLAASGAVQIDLDAAGYGWYIDATPFDDTDDSFAGQMDLLTAVMHEMGHVLGLGDDYDPSHADNLMFGFVTTGERRLPTAGQADGVIVGSAQSTAFIGTPINIGTLPAGKSVQITFQATVNNPFPDGETLVSNQGTVSGTNFSNVVTDDPDTPAADDATDTTIDAAPDLQVTKTDGGIDARPGDVITYTINYRNNGDQVAKNVQLIEALPAGTTFDPLLSALGWTPGLPGVFTLDVGDLQPGESGTVTISVQVNRPVPPGTKQIENFVTIGDDFSNGADKDPADNEAKDTTPIRAANPVIAVGADAGGGPHVRVFDPATGNETFNFFAYNPLFTGGVRVATGDVNGDGFSDIITGAGPTGGPHVKVFDGNTGAEIRSFFAYNPGFTGGIYVAAGDVNNDGFADIITGAGPGGGPHVKVFDGNTGGVLRDFFAYNPSFGGGVRVAGGDVNNDGFADIITGAGPGGGPHVKVFSGQSGQTLQSFFAYDLSVTGGVFVASGDVNNDGFHEVVVSADLQNPVSIFDGQTNALLAVFDPFPGAQPLVNIDRFALTERIGESTVRVATVDSDDDGSVEILTSTGTGLPPEVRRFDANTLQELDRFFAFDQAFANGVFVGDG